MPMTVKAHHEPRGVSVQSWLVFALMLPLCAIGEGASSLLSRFARRGAGGGAPRGSWRAEAYSHASLATSYALMAISMLQSSERRNRPERPS